MANFDYSTSWASGLAYSDDPSYDFMAEGYYYYWGNDGYLHDEQGNIIDADGNVSSISAASTSGSGKSSGNGFFSGTNLNSLLGFASNLLGNNSGNNAGNSTVPRSSTNTLPKTSPTTTQNQPTITTTKKWILPVAIGGGVVLVGLIGILVFKKSK